MIIDRYLAVFCLMAFLLVSCDTPELIEISDRVELIRHFRQAGLKYEGKKKDSIFTRSLILSEGFEEDVLDRWKIEIKSGNAVGSRNEEKACTGRFSFGFEDTTSEEAGQGSEAEVYCIVPVDGDTKFEFEAFLFIESLNRMEARVAGSFYIGEYHDLSELEGRSLLAPTFHVDDQPVTQASDQWIRRTYTFATGKSTRYLKIAFCTGCWGKSRAKIFIDDVSLWRISESPWVGEKILPEVAYQKVADEVRRSLAVPVPSTMKFRLSVPEDSQLSTALGVPQFQEETGRLPVRFKVSARRKYGFPATLTDVTVNPGDDWKEQMIDLSRYSGDEITLSFKVAPVRSGKSSETPAPEKAFWGHPDIRNYHSKSEKRPVIWISMDTLRADHLGCMGYPVYTSPNLDRISTRCFLWVDASSASPWTLPSHASILTGTYPSLHQADDKTGLPGSIQTAAGIFSDLGYFCSAFTTHLYLSEAFGFERGFDTLWCRQDEPAQQVVDRVLSWLDLHADQPFFLLVHFFDPHWDYNPPEPYGKMFDPGYSGSIDGEFQKSVRAFMDPDTPPDPRDLTHIMALYDGEIAYMDAAIGRMFQEFKTHGILDRAYIALFADHGEEFRDHQSMGHGMTLYQEQLHIPLLLSGLNQTPVLIDTPARTIDILPTFLDLTGPQPQGSHAFQGASLIPRFENRNSTLPFVSYAETQLFGLQRFCLRKQSEKLIIDNQKSRKELYDLQTDPQEKTDLSTIRKDTFAEIKKDLDERRTIDHQTAKERKDTTSPVQLDKKQEDLLRSLGYIE